jgi:hypothetical protein
MTKIAESGSGSISRRHGSPEPYQNVMDPQHLCRKDIVFLTPSCRKEGGGCRPTPGSQRTPTAAATVSMLRGSSGAQRQDSSISPSIVSYFTPKNSCSGGGDGGGGGGSTPVSLGKRGLKRRLTDTMQGGGYEVRWPRNLSSVADPDPHVFGPQDPDPLVKGMDPDPDPSIIMQK